MNLKIKKFIKSIVLILTISIITSCSNNDDTNNPCENSTLAVTATVEEYSIKATATGGVEPYEYSIDGTNFQSSNTFNDAVSGNYILTVRDANTCTSTVTITALDAHLNSLLDERDGQRYKIVKIGNQIWLGENFNFDTNTTETISSWCYNDEVANCDTYGKLYTWEAASQLAPEGWKLPSTSDWYELINEVGGYNVAHTELIEGDFELLRAGRRSLAGDFGNLNEYGWYWTSTAAFNTDWYAFYRFDINNTTQGSTGSINALSVRLIKI